MIKDRDDVRNVVTHGRTFRVVLRRNVDSSAISEINDRMGDTGTLGITPDGHIRIDYDDSP